MRLSFPTGLESDRTCMVRADEITAYVEAVRGDHPELSTLIATTENLAGLCEEAVKRADSAAASAKAAEDAARALDDWLQESGFDSVEIGRASCRERVCQYV